MIKNIVFAAIFVAVVGAVWWGFARQEGVPASQTGPASYKDATYTIEGTPVTLADGTAETEAAPGSASKVVTRYFGNEVRTDLNGDGREDVVFLLTQDGGGSGTFFYVVAVLDTAAGWKGSHGYLLGDRIAPQTTELGAGKEIVVNYATRKPGESFATQPSVGTSAYLTFDPATMQFSAVAHDATPATPASTTRQAH